MRTVFLVRTGVQTNGIGIVEELDWMDSSSRTTELKASIFFNIFPTNFRRLPDSVVGIKYE